MKTLPRILIAERLGPRAVRLFFNDGKVTDVTLPIRGAVRILHNGNALRFAPGIRGEVAAWVLYHHRGRSVLPPETRNVDTRSPREVFSRYRKARETGRRTHP